MTRNTAYYFTLLFFLLVSSQLPAQKTDMHFTVTMDKPAEHLFHVELRYSGLQSPNTILKMPAWTPGYYQLLNYAKQVKQFRVSAGNNDSIPWSPAGDNGWTIANGNHREVTVSYDIKAETQFVAQSYIGEDRAYIVPAGVFVYPEGKINTPVTVTIVPNSRWRNVATGLDSIAGQQPTFFAPDFDILYDCPILIGNLEYLPYFMVDGKRHRFIGYQLGNFNHAAFVADLEKVVRGASGIIGHIPYRQYTFLAIGPGRGGIEHLNSTTISFEGKQLSNPEGRLRMLSFIAHEYFHHYNVKRIRPIELGPFDYDKGSRTRMLWVSEGLTVYYEYLALVRAGIMKENELLDALRHNIMNYENKPGRLYQSVVQASSETWSDGPFGRTGEEVNKTISYYDKGPALGMLLDFAIRHHSGNKRSLDDVMRTLYHTYYRKLQRGFTEAEFRQVCEKAAGQPLDEFFSYVNTTNPVDYPKYFSYAGLQVDTTAKNLPGAWYGISTRQRGDTLLVTNVEWPSPAWEAGLRGQDKVLTINGSIATKKGMDELSAAGKPGDVASIRYEHADAIHEVRLTAGSKQQKDFTINRISQPSALQAAIVASWARQQP